MKISGASIRSEASFDDLGDHFNLNSLHQTYKSNVVEILEDDGSGSSQQRKRKEISCSSSALEDILDLEEEEEVNLLRIKKKGKGRWIPSGMTVANISLLLHVF